MSKKMEMRRKLQESQKKLRLKKLEENKKTEKKKSYVSPFERKHGKKASRSDDMPKSKKSTTMTGAERAKALAKKNIKKFGGQAKAAAANKEAMRLKIRKKYLASKKKKK